MGEHAMNARPQRAVEGQPRTAPRLPVTYPGDAAPRESPLLEVVGPVHVERLEFFRALQIDLCDARDLAAVIADEGGFPVLSVTRVDGSRSLTIGCVYWGHVGDWFFATPEDHMFARADDAAGAAAAIREAMRV